MCEVNDAVEKIVIHKGNLIKGAGDFTEYIKSVLAEHGIVSSETSEDEMKVLVKVFKMGAVDAMIFDVAGALGLPAWKAKNKRRNILRKKFLEE